MARVEVYLGEALNRATARLNAAVLGFHNLAPDKALEEVQGALLSLDATYRHLLLVYDDDNRVGFHDATRREHIWVGRIDPYDTAVREADPKQPAPVVHEEIEGSLWDSF